MRGRRRQEGERETKRQTKTVGGTESGGKKDV